MEKKKIIFLTGTRADFGKIKSLLSITSQSELFDVHIFVTGMHLSEKYGYTMNEIKKCGFEQLHPYTNDIESSDLSTILASTINGFNECVSKLNPDLIVVHGDRVEALAGALVGSFKNILVAHVEGGEVSGTIDEHIRHAVSKMSHTHFVANEEAMQRLIQMGEHTHTIHVIGSPDLDIMNSKDLPSLERGKKKYEIPFSEYAILMFHPVTSELDKLENQLHSLIEAVTLSHFQYIVIYPNSDPGSDMILDMYHTHFNDANHFRIIPSIRFEYFLTLIKHAQFIIGNSSAGIREAPFYGVPSINVGSRQHNRLKPGVTTSCVHVSNEKNEILENIKKCMSQKHDFEQNKYFGTGNSAQHFYDIITTEAFWENSVQKSFVDLYE